MPPCTCYFCIGVSVWTSAGGFSLEKTEIAALKDLEKVIKSSPEEAVNVRTENWDQIRDSHL